MKGNIPTYLRTDKTWDAYQTAPKRHNGCFLCDGDDLNIIREFIDWYIVENQYPYDAVAETHHMLVPRRHVKHEDSLTHNERKSLEIILKQLDEETYYDCVCRNFTVGQSHKPHLHYHLIVWKRR